MMSSPVSTIGQPLKPGDKVRTPSGRVAELVAIYPGVQEALVVWGADSARFRLHLLKPLHP